MHGATHIKMTFYVYITQGSKCLIKHNNHILSYQYFISTWQAKILHLFMCDKLRHFTQYVQETTEQN
jgi:hypothetical protein